MSFVKRSVYRSNSVLNCSRSGTHVPDNGPEFPAASFPAQAGPVGIASGADRLERDLESVVTSVQLVQQIPDEPGLGRGQSAAAGTYDEGFSPI